MLEDVILYLKDLYLRSQITADRFKELTAVSNDLRDAPDRLEQYHMLMDYASGEYPEFQRFLTMSRLRAAEELESQFLEKIESYLDMQDMEKAKLMLDMMQTIGL